MITAVLENKIEELTESLGSELRLSLTNLFKTLTKDLMEAVGEVGEDQNDYYVCIHPFRIERVDGEPVPRKVLEALQERLSKQCL